MPQNKSFTALAIAVYLCGIVAFSSTMLSSDGRALASLLRTIVKKAPKTCGNGTSVPDPKTGLCKEQSVRKKSGIGTIVPARCALGAECLPLSVIAPCFTPPSTCAPAKLGSKCSADAGRVQRCQQCPEGSFLDSSHHRCP